MFLFIFIKTWTQNYYFGSNENEISNQSCTKIKHPIWRAPVICEYNFVLSPDVICIWETVISSRDIQNRHLEDRQANRSFISKLCPKKKTKYSMQHYSKS